MNKKPMSKVGIAINLGLIFTSVLMTLAMFSDSELTIDVKIILGIVFFPIIIICSIKLIFDLILRIKYKKNKIPTMKEKEEEISISEWNYNQRNKFPNERTIYDTEINEVLGEKRSFIKQTDKYGNVVLENRNNNIVDWIVVFILGISLNIIVITAFCMKKTPIMGLIIGLLISLLITIFSLLNINRIKKLKLKINFFQILKLIFMLSIEILVFGMLFLTTINFDISKIDFEKIFIFIMILGVLTFIYQIILIVWARIIKK